MSKPTQNSILLLTKNGTNTINSYKAATPLIVGADFLKLLRMPNSFKQIGKTIPYYDVEHRCKGELRQLKT